MCTRIISDSVKGAIVKAVANSEDKLGALRDTLSELKNAGREYISLAEFAEQVETELEGLTYEQVLALIEVLERDQR